MLSVNGTILKGFSLNEVKIERVDLGTDDNLSVVKVYSVLDSGHGGELLCCVARRS